MDCNQDLQDFARRLMGALSAADHDVVDAVSRRFRMTRADVTKFLLSLKFGFTIGAIPELTKDVTLSQLIQAGVLPQGIRLFKEYETGTHRGALVEATLLSGGRILLNKELFNSPSSAAKAAHESIIGKRPPSQDGWWYWSYIGADCKPKKLNDARQEFWAREAQTRSA